MAAASAGSCGATCPVQAAAHLLPPTAVSAPRTPASKRLTPHRSRPCEHSCVWFLLPAFKKFFVVPGKVRAVLG